MNVDARNSTSTLASQFKDACIHELHSRLNSRADTTHNVDCQLKAHMQQYEVDKKQSHN